MVLFQRQTFAIDYGSEYTIRVSTTSQTDISSFTIVNTQTEADLPFTMSEKLVDLSAYEGQSIYIAFVMTNDDGDNWAVDNVNMVPSVDLPNCATVIAPADNAIDVPIGIVPFSWEAPTTGGVPTAYDFFYGVTPEAVDILVGTFTDTTVDITLNDYGFTFYWKIVPKNALRVVL
ncbi:choice-of-anchor J domain-containing protein [Flavobacterium piscinae]|uniref:choice-of-anchor J domain-containing protein n=1 Tax=Flavobacterium piscinae TaxID=2506424 RepID=UPI001986E8AC|nr:choice-of-anchor J domain-containing protein [Flavobacterium piscinae]MBC8882696.1 choice-of-anchor J domain-containing protein [Flavobacterium piscinae]